MEGKFVEIRDKKLVIEPSSNEPKHALFVDQKCEIMIDGKKSKLEDLRPNDQLLVTGNPVTSIKVSRL